MKVAYLIILNKCDWWDMKENLYQNFLKISMPESFSELKMKINGIICKLNRKFIVIRFIEVIFKPFFMVIEKGLSDRDSRDRT